MTIGIVLDEAWARFTRSFLRFFAIASIVFVAVNLLCDAQAAPGSAADA